MLLITGSSGLIGTNLALRLLDHGQDVIGIDLRENGWTDRIPTVIGDLADPCEGGDDVLAGVLRRNGIESERIVGVIHLAALARVYQSVCEPEDSLRNLRIVHTTLEFCRRRTLPFLFASSREVYGNLAGTPGPVDESRAVPGRIASPYAAGKLAAEAYINSYARCFRFPTLICRLSNVYGRYDSDVERLDRVIPLFITRIAAGLPIRIFGPEKILDFTHVDDCVRGLHLGIGHLLETGSCDGSDCVAGWTLNLATGRGHSIPELARLIGANLGVEPQISFHTARPGEVRHYVADITAAEALLGYRPRIDLAEGIARAIAWWKTTIPTPI